MIETLLAEQEEIITKYCDAIFNSRGQKQRNSFYRLGLKDGMKLKKLIKLIIEELS